MDEICGFIENIVFTESERGFTVAKLKEPRKKELTCIVGFMPSIQPGETLRCKGQWKHHAEYGLQFAVDTFDLEEPSDLIGIQKYLESGMIRGIGPVYAERIVNKFGIKTLHIIDQSPDDLASIAGLGTKKIETIKQCWQDQRAIRNVMVFLRKHNVSPSLAQKIYRQYGEGSITAVSRNPYQLARDIRGIGFKTADAIAQGIGIPLDSAERIDAGIEHILWEMSNQGHVGFPRLQLLEEAGLILQIEPSLMEGRLQALIQEERIIEQSSALLLIPPPPSPLVFVKPLYLAEWGIARECARLHQAATCLRSVDVDKAIGWAEQKLGLELAVEQKEAVGLGLQHKMLVITGGPGTGKSTITKAILAITSKITSKILLAAPTGRAAKRMSEITGCKASTIHSLLEMDFKAGGFKRNRQNPLDCDLIIIDEASMIDTQLMNHLLKALPDTTRVILLGDVDQLPSVGPGNVLKDLIDAGTFPVSRLQKIFRQAAGSQIIVNAHRVNQGLFPDLQYHPKSDFRFIAAETPEEILKLIIDQVMVDLPKTHRFNRLNDIQVLAPMKKGIIGIENLNQVLQSTLNPSSTPLIKMGRSFHLGDKVMQIRNNYEKEVYNGDVGQIVEIHLSDQFIHVSFDGTLVEYTFLELDELVLAYAVSIHKYQGSECPCIVMPIHTTHFKMLYRNLLYTGITRGKKRVVLIGSAKALAITVKNADVQRRYSALSAQLRLLLQ